MVPWLFLTVGLTLGAMWAYEELGWGGYWGWDPVENAGLLPWFTATAFLHSVMVQERRGMLKVWNISLVIVTFFLTIFGTFMTRSGVVQSVHAFGEDRELALMFTAFMIFTLAVSFGLVVYRMPLLRARNELDSWASREAAFLANNWVLLFSAFFVLFATMFPTLSEALRGERLTVAGPFFNKWMAPVGLILLFLTGVGPLLAWRKSSVANLRTQFMWPAIVSVAVGTAVVALGVPIWAAGICFALCAWVTTTILQEFVRGALVRRTATGTDLFTSLVGLFSRSRRRYAGYVVHLGIVLIFLGFAGEGLDGKLQEEVGLKPGQAAVAGPYRVLFNALNVTQDAQKQMVTADVTVTRDGQPFARMYPARWYFAGRESEPTTEVALRRGFAHDLHLVLANFEVGSQEVHLQITINPLVNWIWFGVGVMVIGTIIALLPERAFAFSTVRVPSSSVPTSLILLAVLSLGGTQLSAQHVEEPQTVILVPKTPLEKDLQGHIVCMCGGCGRKKIGECTCPMAADMRKDLAGHVASGRTREEIIQLFVSKWGSQEVLTEPIDQGFNRLAWLLPYGVGLGGIVLVGGIALRWSRRRGGERPAEVAHPVTAPAALQDRLDDELRELD
jgi:cytochrome c-type biogenesis protein CcmF